MDWAEYGNPECEASNLYFHETKISVSNQTTSLAEVVTGKGTECMSDEEYKVFEELQIQVYVGKFTRNRGLNLMVDTLK